MGALHSRIMVNRVAAANAAKVKRLFIRVLIRCCHKSTTELGWA